MAGGCGLDRLRLLDIWIILSTIIVFSHGISLWADGKINGPFVTILSLFFKHDLFSDVFGF
jgi:hypothetical protein